MKQVTTLNTNTVLHTSTKMRHSRQRSKVNAIVFAIATSVVAQTSLAATNAVDYPKTATKEEQINNEEIGFGTGAVVGAIFGGPVGAFVVGVTGTFIAKHLNAKDNINDLEVALTDQTQDKQALVAQYQRKLQALEQTHQQELLAFEANVQQASQLQAENLLMSLQFSTGSSEIKPHYESQLVALANMLSQSPELTVDLSGYTDLQGDEQTNLALSTARANSVKLALTGHGIDADRIKLHGYGEQSPVVANMDKEVSFYDRRVVIKLNRDSGKNSNQHTANNR